MKKKYRQYLQYLIYCIVGCFAKLGVYVSFYLVFLMYLFSNMPAGSGDPF
jgi:hypothetical protein